MRIAIVMGSYPLEVSGGAEHQAFLLAKGLVNLGHEVTYLAIDADENRELRQDGVTVRKMIGRGVVGRSKHASAVAAVLESGGFDLCYLRWFDRLWETSRICHRIGVPLVSMTCHGDEAKPLLPSRDLAFAFEHLVSFMAIRSSADHVCNSGSLQRRVQRWFPDRQIRCIYNGAQMPPESEIHVGSSKRVIWVNNLKKWKRPEEFINLARALPDYEFVMVGRMAGGNYGERLSRLVARAPGNLTYLGERPLTEVNAWIGRSDVLVYTSRPSEGFGNSLVQAWMRRVPTVSLDYDPDGIIEREKLGRRSTSAEQLAEDVRELLTNESLRCDMGQRARDYASRLLNAPRMVADYELLFEKVIDGTVDRTSDVQPSTGALQ